MARDVHSGLFRVKVSSKEKGMIMLTELRRLYSDLSCHIKVTHPTSHSHNMPCTAL